MSNLKNAKERYDNIPIPEELSSRVQSAIKQSAENRGHQQKVTLFQKRHSILKRSLGAAAAVALTFTLALNTSTAFAQEMKDIPVLGSLAQVLTFRSYEETTEDYSISVDIPSLEMLSANGFSNAINKEILFLCEAYADEAVARAEEYKKAFLATGGTEEEWAAHNIQIQVGYEIKSQTEDYLSFAVTGTENWSNANNKTTYYNIDLNSEKLVTLADILGADYADIANQSILAQMAESNVEFFTPEAGGFTGISENQRFYMNEAGNPVVVFEKYTIAPGAYGEQEFEIIK